MMTSFKLVTPGADTPVQLSTAVTDGAGTLLGSLYFYGGEFYLSPNAVPDVDGVGARIGGPEVSMANKIGSPLLPGQYYPMSHIAKMRHTKSTWITFSDADVTKNIISGSIERDV